MERKFRSHLAHAERCQIYAYKSTNLSNREIARLLGVSASTVGSEIKRNSGLRGYEYQQAQNDAAARRKKASSIKRVATIETIKLVIKMLRETHSSPVQISGRLKLEHNINISHETIYQIIFNDRINSGDLFKFLRRKGRKLRFHKTKAAGRGLIPDRRDISERPAVAGLKKEAGHYEADTIVGKDHKGAIVSLVDKALKYTMLELIPAGTAHLVSEALILRLNEMQKQGIKVHTITSDNGKEFSYHKKVSTALQADFYFARPYKSCDRGLNEHTNGLVREFLPKKTDFTKVSHEYVAHIEWMINNRPRKSLDFRTPMEVVNSLLLRQSVSVAIQH